MKNGLDIEFEGRTIHVSFKLIVTGDMMFLHALHGTSGPCHSNYYLFCERSKGRDSSRLPVGEAELRDYADLHRLAHHYQADVMLDADGNFIPYTYRGCGTEFPTRAALEEDAARELSKADATTYATRHKGMRLGCGPLVPGHLKDPGAIIDTTVLDLLHTKLRTIEALFAATITRQNESPAKATALDAKMEELGISSGHIPVSRQTAGSKAAVPKKTFIGRVVDALLEGKGIQLVRLFTPLAEQTGAIKAWEEAAKLFTKLQTATEFADTPQNRLLYGGQCEKAAALFVTALTAVSSSEEVDTPLLHALLCHIKDMVVRHGIDLHQYCCEGIEAANRIRKTAVTHFGNFHSGAQGFTRQALADEKSKRHVWKVFPGVENFIVLKAAQDRRHRDQARVPFAVVTNLSQGCELKPAHA